MDNDPIDRIKREWEARQEQQYIDRLIAADFPGLLVDRKAFIEYRLNDLRKISVTSPADDRMLQAELLRLSAELDAVKMELRPTRKALLAQTKARGFTDKQVAVRSFPEIHPNKAVARLNAWAKVKVRRYPDGSDGDKAIRAAISSFLVSSSFPK